MLFLFVVLGCLVASFMTNVSADSRRQRDIFHGDPLHFVNRPLPMQAVVQLDAPPGTPVYKLQARDPDPHHTIHYFLVNDLTGGRFEVDELSGEVRTVDSDPFELGKEYVLHVKAMDHNGTLKDRRHQSTGEERLSIMGGKRPPQFYKQNYEATIPKNQMKDTGIIEVKAKSFADHKIRYILRTQGRGAGTFNIGPTSGVVYLAKDLDIVRPRKTFGLIITATEDSTGLTTHVELIIKITDANDTPPSIQLPDSKAHNVDKDVAVGTSILQEPIKTERDLRKALFKDYDKLVRPVRNPNDVISVFTELVPIGIKNIEVGDKIIKLDTLFYTKWQDQYLTWDPSVYGGLDQFSLSSAEVWKPDVAVYAGYSEGNYFPTGKTNVVLFANGTVLWVQPFNLHARCSITPKQDTDQTFECIIPIGTWTNDIRKITLHEVRQDVLQGMAKEGFHDHNRQWKLESMTASSRERQYSCCSHPFSLVLVDIVFRKKELLVF